MISVKIQSKDWVAEVSSEIRDKAKKIKVILMDVDGVLTRGDIIYDSNGLEIKHFNAHDGQYAEYEKQNTGIKQC